MGENGCSALALNRLTFSMYKRLTKLAHLYQVGSHGGCLDIFHGNYPTGSGGGPLDLSANKFSLIDIKPVNFYVISVE